MEKANKIDRSKYTEESLKALDDAIAAVEKRSERIRTEQS